MKGPDNPPKKLVYQTYNNEWEPVTIPPLIRDMTITELERFHDKPMEIKIPCHSQTVEHTVALVSQATQRRRTEDTQLMNVLQVSSARKNFKGKVTHRRFAETENSENAQLPLKKSKLRTEDSDFNRVLYK